MNNYKDELYDNYVSSHIKHRKNFSLDSYKRGFNQHFGRFLNFKKDRKIIDLGCGSGSLVNWLHNLGYRNSFGIDTSREQIEVAKSNDIENIIEGNVFDFLKKNSDFKLIFARDLIEHFDNQSCYDFLKLCFGSLSEDGKIVLQIPNGESPYFGRIRYGDFTHELVFTSASIKQILASIGFEEIKVYPWRPIISSSKSLIRFLIWRLIEVILIIPLQIETGSGNRIVTMNLIVEAKKNKFV